VTATRRIHVRVYRSPPGVRKIRRRLGDPRSAYALVDDDQITIRRVAYDIEREVTALFEAQYPAATWLADILRKGAFMPPPD